MSQSVVEKTVCEECGVDVRENTLYCYNCGSRIDEPPPSMQLNEVSEEDPNVESEPIERPDELDETASVGGINTKGREALEELARRIRIDDPSDDAGKIARAAADRKRSRSAKRKGVEYVWEPVDEPPGRLFLVFVGLIVLLSAFAVVITVIWK